MTMTTPRTGSTVPDNLRTSSPAWALAGIGAAFAAMAGIVGSGLSGAVYDPDLQGDAEGITAKLGDLVAPLMLFHVATVISALLLVVFAAGLHRYLGQRLLGDSLLPRVASQGIVLVTVMQLVGTALDTEFIFGVQDPDMLVPESAVMFGHWVGTVPWVWAGAGVAALALAVAVFRHAAAPRWIGLVSAVLGTITTLLAISPLQYMAGMTGPLWLLVCASGLAVVERRTRA